MSCLDTSRDIESAYAKFVVPTYARSLSLVRGKGIKVWDAEGREYLDFSGGIAVNCLGHAHSVIAETLHKQASLLVHTSNLFYTRPQVRLAEELVGLSGPGKIFFCNSGAEANEALYKLARRVGHDAGRFEILTAENSFHGRTLAGIAATGQDKVKKGFDPITPGFRYIPYNDLAAAEAAIDEKTAAILIEGIQGEGGVTPATPEYLLGLRALCDRHGILLMMDAVQCGMFRTGTFLSSGRILENTDGGEDFSFDAVSMAKSLGGGFPIGCTWISEKYQDVLDAGSHGTTYGGTPLACAVALSVMEVIREQNLAHNARRIGEFLGSNFSMLSAKHPDRVVAVRGFGCMLGVEIVEPVAGAVSALRHAGLIVVPAGRNTVRWLPPLNVTMEECTRAIEIFAAYLSAPLPSPKES